jgi:hypothetical protein
LIDGEENIDTIGYHVSNAVFDQFDDSRIGRQQSNVGSHGKYSVDSFLGHQFYPDANFLYQYQGRSDLLGNFMYKVNLRIGKAAVIDIYKLKNVATTPEIAAKIKNQLQSMGYNGIRLVGGGKGKLMGNTIVAFSSQPIRIRSLKNLKTGQELKAKDGPFAQQIQQLKANPQHMQLARQQATTNQGAANIQDL